MTDIPSSKPVLVFVKTRAIDGEAFSGRARTMTSIRTALSRHFDLREIRLLSLIERKSVSACLQPMLNFGWKLLTLRPQPLQCALFDASRQNPETVRQILALRPAAVYLDTIRCISLLLALRRAAPNLRIVMDMDDLMSRRIETFQQGGHSFSLGYLKKDAPRVLQWLLSLTWLTRLLLAYEVFALRRAERRAALSADAVTLVSEVEAQNVREAVPEAKERILTLPPPVAVIRPAQPRATPMSFCFVGSDRQVQNRGIIDFLLEIWERRRPSAALRIIGEQTRPPVAVHNVTWLGSIPSLDAAYDRHAVLVSPYFIHGGIKTKIADALGYGVPVITNWTGMEGIGFREYPLIVEDFSQIEEMICDPESWRERFDQAAAAGNDLVSRRFRTESYEQRWRELLAGDGAAQAKVIV
jgi:hypothetical protein